MVIGSCQCVSLQYPFLPPDLQASPYTTATDKPNPKPHLDPHFDPTPPHPQVSFSDNLVDDGEGNYVFRSDTHRKVALYYGLADTQDAVGHGSHTAGTIAGSRWGGAQRGVLRVALWRGLVWSCALSTALHCSVRCSFHCCHPSQQTPPPNTHPDLIPPKNSRYDTNKPDGATGMAPNARLAISDLSKGPRGTVSAPDDLSDSYFKPAYEAGARVHSDSWGSDVIGGCWGSRCAVCAVAGGVAVLCCGCVCCRAVV